MDARLRIAALALCALTLGGCAIGNRLGWTAKRVQPAAEIQASCEDSVKTLVGQPDHDLAMRACVDAKARQGVD